MDKIGIIGATDNGIDALKLIMKSDSSDVGVRVGNSLLESFPERMLFSFVQESER